MPATTRYSATFDCPYEEEPAQPPANPRSRSQSLYNFTNGGSLSNHDGASAQNTTENTERIPTRSVVKSSTKPAHNPLQFVKTSMCPLYKQAEEQMKKAKEVKKTVEVLKEEEEWLSNLDDWKSRRRKLSEHVIRRQEEMKQIEQEEQLWLQQKKQTKTFSEMVEERTHRGRSLSLNLFSSPFEVDFFSNKSKSFFDESDECQEESEECKDTSCSNSITSQQLHKSDKNGFSAQKRKTGNIKHNGEYPSVFDNHLDSSSSLEFSVDKGRESMTGLYTDSGLDSLSSSHRAGEIVDSGSDFSQDSGSSLESDITGLVTTGTELLEEYSSKKTNGVELFLRISLNKAECKDFGFTFKHKKNEVVVDFVSPDGPSDVAGLCAQDRLITINGKDARHLDPEEIKCQLKNSVHTGSLDILLCRPKSLNNGIEHRNGSSGEGTKEKSKTVDSTLSSDSSKKSSQTSVKPKVSAVKRPPPIPAKPKLKPKEVKGVTQKLDTDSESNDSEISEKIGRQSSLKERSIESENEMFVDDFEELQLLSNGASSIKQNSVPLMKKETELSDKTGCKKVIVKSKLKTAQHTTSA